VASAAQTISPVARVLIIGLDGATWTNLKPLAERGDMPVLQRLMREGAWGTLDSTIPALTPPAWTSLVTGTNPGKHGIYHFRHTPAGDYYQRRLNNARDIRSQTLWQRLGAHGKKVGVINVPLSHPVYPVNGFMTSDPFAPEAPQVSVYPPELAAEFHGFIADVTEYPTAHPTSSHYTKQILEFIDHNEKILLLQAETELRLMKSQPWDFFMVAWMLNDRFHHFCWRFCDPGSESSLKTPEEKQIAARCLATLRQLDTQLGRLCEAAGDNCAVVLASDHGGGPSIPAFFHTNRWLIQRGYLRLLPIWNWRRAAIGYLPRSWKAKLGVPIDSKHGLVDWSRTRVWADPLESRALAININRIGRFPEGIVPDAECEVLLKEVVKELSDLRTPHGAKVFAEIHPGTEIFRGSRNATVPDLVGVLDKSLDVPASFRRDVRSSKLIVPNRHALRDGGHEPEGIYLFHGPNIRPAGMLPPQSIVSIAPTVLALYGLPISDDMDTEPIVAALTDEFLRAYPPRRESKPASADMPTSAAQPEYSDEDSAKIEERLRKLGYLD
jgi:predicted AlkP superfamily phosphohydrolase/phosphomutase